MRDREKHMKRIIKNDEPAFLGEWIERFRSDNGRDPLYADLREKPEWYQLRNLLSEEQGWICCYCMKRIDDSTSHIEHFVPRSIRNQYPHSQYAQNVELDYFNMFMSCEGENQEKHCGRLKDNHATWMLVSPSEETVEEQFQYYPDGRIEGSSPKAIKTIEVTGLDTFSLQRHRRTAIYLAVEKWTPEMSLEQYLQKDANGMFPPYCHAVLYCLKALLL